MHLLLILCLCFASLVCGGRLNVIGHYPSYIETAKEIDAAYFDSNSSSCAPLTFDISACWQENEEWLRKAMQNEDTFLISTPQKLIRAGSFLANEIDFILTNGDDQVPIKYRYKLMLVPVWGKAVARRFAHKLHFYDESECTCGV